MGRPLLRLKDSGCPPFSHQSPTFLFKESSKSRQLVTSNALETLLVRNIYHSILPGTCALQWLPGPLPVSSALGLIATCLPYMALPASVVGRRSVCHIWIGNGRFQSFLRWTTTFCWQKRKKVFKNCKLTSKIIMTLPSIRQIDWFEDHLLYRASSGRIASVFFHFLLFLRPTGGVKHSDSYLVETGMLSAKKALRWIEGSILSNSRNF